MASETKILLDLDNVNDYFNDGDMVTVSEGVRHCKHGVNKTMIGMIGQTYTISEIKPAERDGSGRPLKRTIYLKDADWTWDTGCFEVPYIANRVFVPGGIDELF